MRLRFPSLPRLKHHSRFTRILPLVMFCLSLSITLFGWHMVSTTTRLKAFQIYTDSTEDLVDHLERQLHVHQQVLRGGSGLFNVKSDVTRSDWRDYVASLQLDQYHPGILGIGYAVWLTPAEVENNQRVIRSEGFPGYTIRPAGERPVYSSIIYLEPFTWRNQRAFGYDMYTEPIRRAAMSQARDKGIATIAAPITLVQETEVGKQHGMLMYVPVYRQGVAVDSVNDRRAALRGFVYSPIRMNDFVYGTLGKLPDDVAFEIYAGDTPNPATRMFSSLESGGIILPPEYQSLFTSGKTVDIFGSKLHFVFRSLPAFDTGTARGQSPVALVGGGFFVSILLSVVTYMLLFTRDKALSLAREMTDELRKSERILRASQEHFQALVTASPVGVFETDVNSLQIMCNEQWLKITGLTVEQARGMGWTASLHPDDRERIAAEWQVAKAESRPYRLEHRHLTPDGVESWVLAQACAMKDDTGEITGYIGTITDITELKLAEQELQESNRRFSTIFHHSPVAISLSFLRSGEYTDVNETFLQLIGYGREKVIGSTALALGLWSHEDERSAMLAQIHENGRGYQFEKIFIDKSGEQRHLLVSVEQIRISGEEYLLAMISDITTRKNAELLLACVNEELEKRINDRTADLSLVNAKLILEIEERKKLSRR